MSRYRVPSPGLSRALSGCLIGLAICLAGAGSVPAREALPELDIVINKVGLPTVAIVTTGGTIAERTDPKTGADVPAVSGKAVVAAVPRLKDLANIGVLEFSNIDSSQMTPEIWARLSKAVDELLARDDVAGAVITHGTDTMALGAFLLDVTLKSDKPVVFTDALNDASSAEFDGPFNMYNAVVQVLSKRGQNWGVTVTLNRFVNSARDVRKTDTTNIQAFSSGEKGYLGYVYGTDVTRFNDRVRRVRLPLPSNSSGKLPNVPFISMYAGSDGRFIRYAVDTGARGLVVEGVGAGNVNAEMFEAIEYALSKDIPVVIASRVYYGAVEPIYGDKGGGKMLLDAGCILAGDLVGTKARLLLMIGLMRYGNDTAKLSALFRQ